MHVYTHIHTYIHTYIHTCICVRYDLDFYFNFLYPKIWTFKPVFIEMEGFDWNRFCVFCYLLLFNAKLYAWLIIICSSEHKNLQPCLIFFEKKKVITMVDYIVWNLTFDRFLVVTWHLTNTHTHTHTHTHIHILTNLMLLWWWYEDNMRWKKCTLVECEFILEWHS